MLDNGEEPVAVVRCVYVDDPFRTFNTDLQQTIETRNLIDVAETITLDALVRNEFRAPTGARKTRSATTRTGSNTR